MDGLPGEPEAARLADWNDDIIEPAVSIKAGWRIVSVPGIDPVEIGLARQQAVADQLAGPLPAPALMFWRCRRALLVSRSETRLPHFSDAVVELQTAGWPVVLRKSGGGACPVGPGTVQVSLIEPAAPGATMNDKYAALAALLQAALRRCQIVGLTGSVAGAYCPGHYDLAVAGKKLAGMSQHWFRNRAGIHCVVTAASINIAQAPDEFAWVVNQFYGCAGSPLRCRAAALTNLRLCGGATAVRGMNFAAAVIDLLRSSNAEARGASRRN